MDARAAELLAERAAMPSQFTVTDKIGIYPLIDKGYQISK